MRKTELLRLIEPLIEAAGLSCAPLYVMIFKQHTFCVFYNDSVIGWYNAQSRIFKTAEGERYHIYEETPERMSQVLYKAITQTKPSTR